MDVTTCRRGGGGAFARGQFCGENFAFQIGDEIFPAEFFFAQFDSWLTMTVTGCLACPISGSL